MNSLFWHFSWPLYCDVLSTFKMHKSQHIFSMMLILAWLKRTKWGLSGIAFFPRFLSFIVFAISKSPQGYASAALQHAQLGKKAGCHFCELAAAERRGKMTQSSEKWFGWWGWGLMRGRLQRSPAPRQMCLGVTLHPQPNESPNRCLTSGPGCHASQTHTCTHQPCKDMHTHCTIYHYIRKSGSTRGQTKALMFTLMWLWPKIPREISLYL